MKIDTIDKKPTITFIFGTRPEAIKLASVILVFQKSLEINTKIVITGQHNEMLLQVLDVFNLKFDHNLSIFSKKQSLEAITTKTINNLSNYLEKEECDLIIVQGDTSSAFSAALTGFYKKIPVAHIEAGLRTDNIYDPFPEEINRRLISNIANIHFAPTIKARDNLVKSNIIENVHVTGNTVIDTMLLVAKSSPDLEIKNFNNKKNKLILVTIHRRENWGKKTESISNGLRKFLDSNPEAFILIPMHLNKIVRDPIKKILGNHPRVILKEPLDYQSLIATMKLCYFLITDSGGLQEEAPSLGKPVLIIRETTERPEAIEAGTAKLIGTNCEKINSEANLLFRDKVLYRKMARSVNPFGDGKASKRILKIVKNFLNVVSN